MAHKALVRLIAALLRYSTFSSPASLRGEHQWLKMKLRVGAPTIFLQFLTNHYFSSLLEHPLFSVNLAVFDWGLRFPISDSRKIDNLNAINDAGDDEIQFSILAKMRMIVEMMMKQGDA